MEVHRCSTSQEFLAATASYRGLDPIRTNVMGSVAESVALDARSYDAYWWWLVTDDNGDIVGAALRTAPFGLQIGPMPVSAAAQLAIEVAKDDDEVPWIIGPDPLATAFLDSYRATNSPGSSRRADRQRKDLIYEVVDLVVPDVEGACRPATVDDFDLVDQWWTDFMFVVDGVTREPDDRDRAVLVTRLNEGAIKLWCVRSVVVAMAGRATPVNTPSGFVTRIGPVFTPAENRDRGYGSAVSACLSDELLRGGSRVMLHADADNPTSNSIYKKIGYQLIDNVVQYSFVAR